MNESRRGDIFQPGDLLNNTYRIDSLLGRGGTSEVYKARNEISGRFTAIKALKAEFSGNEDYLTLMTREEEIRDIRHDAVVRYSENHRTLDGNIYLVMDYVEGPGLDAVLRGGGMSAEQLIEVGRKVTQGLQAAHAHNIIHRDLSPDNIILRGGVPSEAVIIDFGIAKDTNPGAETIVGNEFAGKYAYAAPEQLSGQTDKRTDLYSLGALLLATFRGAKPDIGNNPMEVVQKKADPLNTEGVPEPLKSLIDKMSHPDPDQRYQSAKELLAAMEPGAQLDVDDATVFAPAVPAAKLAEQEEIIGVSPQKKSSNLEPAKSRSGMWAVLLVLLLAGGAGGAFYGGYLDQFIGQQLQIADPYSLTAEMDSDGQSHITGFVPSAEVETGITQIFTAMGGTATLTLATGNIAESWGEDVQALLKILGPLDVWRLTIHGNNVQVTGLTNDRLIRDSIDRLLADGLPGALLGTSLIQLGPLIVTTSMLQPTLDQFADCGRLTLEGAPAIGFGTGAEIHISGKFASPLTLRNLRAALEATIGDRSVVFDTEILNQTLCLIEGKLPDAPSGGMNFLFENGNSGAANRDGSFKVGENPVIDVLIPADIVDGFLSVSILDVSGSVFHLLPNLNRPENDIAVLRNGATGPFKVRVAFSLSESAISSKLAFIVDDSALGKSKILALHSPEPLFDISRPTTESAAGYAEALREQSATGSARIFALDAGILTTTN